MGQSLSVSLIVVNYQSDFGENRQDGKTGISVPERSKRPLGSCAEATNYIPPVMPIWSNIYKKFKKSLIP